jgi:folate-binding protein YgfZ
MNPLALHDFHQARGASFTAMGEMEAVEHYGDWLAEYGALRSGAGLLDLSFRSRLCVLGADRQRFLNGQVTNNVKDLKPGMGCYAALVTAKGKIQSDLNVYCLENEILLDFEPGLAAAVQARLEKYVIAEDAQIVDASPHYGLLSAQGPRASDLMAAIAADFRAPTQPMSVSRIEHPAFGEIYLTIKNRTGLPGCDIFVPIGSMPAVAEALTAAGARWCGWKALETARIESAIPRFGADMDETNLAPEAGIENSAISYTKGCYIGQEVIARIRTYGQVAKSLRGLRLGAGAASLPLRGDKIFNGEKEAGYITSATLSPALNAPIALAYVRREAAQTGSTLEVHSGDKKISAEIVNTPFVSATPAASGVAT